MLKSDSPKGPPEKLKRLLKTMAQRIGVIETDRTMNKRKKKHKLLNYY